MSAGATWFGIYFGIGLILMILTLASHRGRKRAELLAGGAPDELSAVLLIFVALLWPVWLIAMLTKR